MQPHPQNRWCAAAATPRPFIGGGMNPAIRIALLDDHPAIRAGFEVIVAAEADLQVVGFAANEAELWPILRQTRPDVLVLDAHHPGRGGLELCVEIKRRQQAPAIVIHTATATDSLVAAAALAGAGAVVSKSAPTIILLDAIRALAMAPRTTVPLSWRIAREAAARLDSADHAILAMALAGNLPDEIGDTLWLPPSAVVDRITAMVTRLEPIGSFG